MLICVWLCIMCLIVYYVGDGDKAHKEYGEVQFCHCIYCGWRRGGAGGCK